MRVLSIGTRLPTGIKTARTYAQLVRSGSEKHARRVTKKEGTVAEFFENLISEGPPLPPRFADLKKEMCADRDALVHSWRAVLRELGDATEEIAQRGNEVCAGSVGPVWAVGLTGHERGADGHAGSV